MIDEVCSFCGTSKAQATVLVASPGATICGSCIRLGLELQAARDTPEDPNDQALPQAPAARRAIAETLAAAATERARNRAVPSKYECTFCGKPRKHVRFMMSGPDVFICDQCLTTAAAACPRTGHES